MARQRQAMINLLINLAALKSGGGQNVALNLLYSMPDGPVEGITCWYMVARGSDVLAHLRRSGCARVIVAPRSPWLRILFEALAGRRLLRRHRIDIIYSYFGYAWFPRRWPQITGSADSNLYFPEIDFWSDYRGLDRLKRAVVDAYRRRGIRRADAVVFENAALEERGRLLYGLRRTTVIRPSIAFSDRGESFRLPPRADAREGRGLFLCGWQLNKNIMVIPELAAELRRRGRLFLFVVTASPDGCAECREFATRAQRHGVDDCILLSGPARKDQLASLYAQIDFVFLLSKLESFSNNIIEAWHFGKPLVLADEPWARAICQDAATYVSRDSVPDIADKVCALLEDPAACATTVARGAAMLRAYPTMAARIEQELQYVRLVLENR